MEFKEFTNPEEKDHDITSSFTEEELTTTNKPPNKIKKEFDELIIKLGIPEVEELLPYGISEEEYANPNISTLNKLKEYNEDIKNKKNKTR